MKSTQNMDIESSKLCQHGKYKWDSNLRRTWFVMEERYDDYNTCCNEKMQFVFSSRSKAVLDLCEDRLSLCSCCGKLVNPYRKDLQNMDNE